MRKVIPFTVEQNRITDGEYGSNASYGMMGGFRLMGDNGADLLVMSSGVDKSTGWEHVSVSARGRCPTWTEMCKVKDLFWTEDECVIQYHPPKSEYVNFHPHVLHMWKPIGMMVPMPPSLLVGPKVKPARQ